MNDLSATAVLKRETDPMGTGEWGVGNAQRRPISALSLVVWGCTAALLIALAWPMFAGRVYVADDLGAMHLPMRMFYSGQLAAGEPFDWNPDLFGGFYLTGEGQAGTYH